MKHSSLKSIIAIFLLMVVFTRASYAQYSSRHLTRGSDTAEIYLSCQWYADPDYTTWNGLFRSTDNGQTLSVQRKTNWLVEAGEIFGDSSSGVVFQIPFIGQDTFGVSSDYGVTFVKKYFHNIYKKAAGCMAGELYITGFGLYHGTDYGDTFTLQSTNDTLLLQDVGALPGEVYAAKKIGWNPLKLAYSNDYGETFSITDVTFPGLPGMYDYCDIHRGTAPGELYFVIWKSYWEIALYHTFDYGQTVTLQSERDQNYDEILYTAGRTPGTFYYARREVCGPTPFQHSCIWIYFSRDYGVTFTTYYHELDSLYTAVDRNEVLPKPTIFPNPSREKITIKLPGILKSCNTHITLYDIFGRVVASVTVTSGSSEVTLDTSQFAPGSYLCELVLNEFRVYSKLMILKL